MGLYFKDIYRKESEHSLSSYNFLNKTFTPLKILNFLLIKERRKDYKDVFQATSPLVDNKD